MLLAKEDFKNLSKSIVQLNLKNSSILNLRELVNSLSDEYLAQEYKAIRSWVDSLPFGLKSTVHANSKNYKSLIEILEKEGEFEWLKLYDYLLLKNGYYKDVKRIYCEISEKFLSQHVGSKANDYVAKLKVRLLNIGQEHLLEEILYILSEKFSHRSMFKTI